MLGSTLLISILSWAAGILAAVIAQQILNRRRVLSYFVQHQYLGSSAQDRTFGKVDIKWNDSPVANLYLSTIQMTNESSRDLTDVIVKAFTGDTTLLSEFTELVGTTEIVKYSSEYESTLTVPEHGRPTEIQIESYSQRREYSIPVMNRGQIVRFQFLNTPNTPNQPNIWLDIVHPGVTLKFENPKPLIHGVPQHWASLAGVIAGLVVASFFSVYSPYTWLTAFGCLFFGLTGQIAGAYFVRSIRIIRRWLAG